MRRHITLQGNTVEEKLAHVERILDSFRGRLGSKVIGIIPPVPIMHYCAFPENGVIARLLIPISGVIERACVRIGHYANRSATITVLVISGESKYAQDFLCNKLAHQHLMDQRIEAGDVIEVYGEGVSDIHVAIAIQPDISQTTREIHMLEGFMALLNEENDNGDVI